MTHDRNRPAKEPQGEHTRTPYAWHFRKLMDVLEQILQAIRQIDLTQQRQDDQRPSGQ